MSSRGPAGIVERLRGCSHGKENEIIDFELLLRLHPIVSIKGSGRAVTARDLTGNLAGDVGYVEFFYAINAALPGEQSLPSLLDPTGERRHQSEPRDNHASHRGRSRSTKSKCRPTAYRNMRRLRQSISIMQKI